MSIMLLKINTSSLGAPKTSDFDSRAENYKLLLNKRILCTVRFKGQKFEVNVPKIANDRVLVCGVQSHLPLFLKSFVEPFLGERIFTLKNR